MCTKLTALVYAAYHWDAPAAPPPDNECVIKITAARLESGVALKICVKCNFLCMLDVMTLIRKLLKYLWIYFCFMGTRECRELFKSLGASFA